MSSPGSSPNFLPLEAGKSAKKTGKGFNMTASVTSVRGRGNDGPRVNESMVHFRSNSRQFSASSEFQSMSGGVPKPFHSPPSSLTMSLSYSTKTQELRTISVPPNAASLLKKALKDAHNALLSFDLHIGDIEEELKEKRSTVELLRQQEKRRREWLQCDTEAVEALSRMFADINVAVRDRRTSLTADGYQALLFPNQDLYEGAWKNCKMHGKGFLKRHELQDVYEGQWFSGQRYGNGSLHSARFHMFYTGSWLDNRRHGKGELIEPEGCFVGDFVDNQMEGYGEYIYTNGHVYKGEWVNNFYEGNGTYFYPSGAKYEGQWRGGQEHGKGTMTYFNGDVYSGEWACGKPHGYGTYTGPYCQVEGCWEYGSLAGEATCLFADGSRYRGMLKRNLFDGKGEFSTVSGIVYQGDFQLGKRHGTGSYASSEEVYEGRWAADQKEGEGQLQLLGVGKVDGNWRKDNLTAVVEQTEARQRRHNQHHRIVDAAVRGNDDTAPRSEKIGFVPYIDVGSSGSSSSSSPVSSVDAVNTFLSYFQNNDHRNGRNGFGVNGGGGDRQGRGQAVSIDQMQLFSPEETDLKVGFAGESLNSPPHGKLKRAISRTLPHLNSHRSMYSATKRYQSDEDEDNEKNGKDGNNDEETGSGSKNAFARERQGGAQNDEVSSLPSSPDVKAAGGSKQQEDPFEL